MLLPKRTFKNFELEKFCEYLMKHGHDCTSEMVYREILRCIPVFIDIGFDISNDYQVFARFAVGAGVGKCYDEVLCEIKGLMTE